MNHSFVCNNKYLNYLFNCKTCAKQYMAKTIDHFRGRSNNDKSEIRKAESGNMEMTSKN